MTENDNFDFGCLVIEPNDAVALYGRFREDGLGHIEARQRILELDRAVQDCAINEYEKSLGSGDGIIFLKDLEDRLEIIDMTAGGSITYTPSSPRHKRDHVPSEEPSAFVKYVGTQKDQFPIV